ncbi:MAG: TauD/TfdA family dioxygenase [Pseudomonadota bacterium]
MRQECDMLSGRRFHIEKVKPFGAILQSDNAGASIHNLDAAELRSLLRENQLLVLRGFASVPNRKCLIQFSQSLGEISMWPFGEVLELVEQRSPEDHIFDNNYVPLHWDGMYRPHVPEIQVFQCVRAPEESHGGETTFSNTRMVLERMTKAEVSSLRAVSAYYERNMEYYQSKTLAPIVNSHPEFGFDVIRYCEPPETGDKSFINHPGFELRGLDRDNVTEFQQKLKEELYFEENFYAHKWQTDDVVLSDNYTLLHGRNKFTSGCSRHLRRVHVLGLPALKNPHLLEHQ